MTGRLRDAITGLAALLALVVVLVGPPLALAHFVGWPLPTRLPVLDEMAAAARGGIDDIVVVKFLAVLAWITWAQLALAALTEMVAMVRGRRPGRALALPVLQIGMGRLVATAALLVAGLSPPRPVAVPMARLVSAVAAPAPPRPVVPEHPSLSDGATTLAAPQPPRPTVPAEGQLYTAVRSDSWWAVAERTLGEGERWKELRSLNLGRTMADGTVIDAATETMRIGWQIVVPAGTQLAPAAPVPAVGTGEEVVAQPGDNLWSIAAEHLHRVRGTPAPEGEVRDYWVRLIESNRDRLADANDPGRIYAGQPLRLPPVPERASNGGAPAPASEPARPARADPVPKTPPTPEGVTAITPPARRTQAPAATTPDTRARATTAPVKRDRSAKAAAVTGARRTRSEPTLTRLRRAPDAAADEGRDLPVAALGTASTVLAVGLGAALRRRRRRRQAELPPRVEAPVPASEYDDLRAEIALAADVDQARRLQRAMADIAACLAERGSDVRPRLVQASGNRIEVLLSRAVLPAAPGWRPEASGSAWVLKGEPQESDGDFPTATPTLVSIGRPDDGAELYLDLEAEGVVSVTGDATAAGDLVRSWVLELASSPSAGDVSVALVADNGLVPSGTWERVRVADNWDKIAGDALAWAEQSRALLAANRWTTPLAGRSRSRRPDDLAPMVVVLAERPADERFEELCTAILEGNAAVTVVVIGDTVDHATTVHLDAGELRIPSLGLTCKAQAVSAPAAARVDDLLEDASSVPDQLVLVPPPAPAAPVMPGRADEPYKDPPFDILVRLLGDIFVVGGNRQLKPKQAAVVAFIALHAPVASDRVEDALWVAPTASRRKRLANTVSESRTALGHGYLPPASDGRYRVGPGVITDTELFDRRLAYAAEQDEVEAVETLRGALELVEGPVFTYRSADRASYVWVDVGNWVSTWELKVTDTAEDLAQRCLDLGDVAGAVWAAQRGLLSCPTHSRLTKLLMEAYFAEGDAKAAQRVFESHQAALEQLELDEVAPELVDFYTAARRSGAASATG